MVSKIEFFGGVQIIMAADTLLTLCQWWSKCISMVIAKTAGRNVIYKANKLGESMFVRQSEMLIPEEELGSQSPVSYEEDFEDLSSNVDLYVFNDQMVQGYRGVNICLLYTSPSPRDATLSRMPSSA